MSDWCILEDDPSDFAISAYLTEEINPGLAKQPMKLNGGLAKFGTASLVNERW